VPELKIQTWKPNTWQVSSLQQVGGHTHRWFGTCTDEMKLRLGIQEGSILTIHLWLIVVTIPQRILPEVYAFCSSKLKSECGCFAASNSQLYYGDSQLGNQDIPVFGNRNRIFRDVQWQPVMQWYVNMDVNWIASHWHTSPSGFLLGWVPVHCKFCAYSSHLGLASESQVWNILRSIVWPRLQWTF